MNFYIIYYIYPSEPKYQTEKKTKPKLNEIVYITEQIIYFWNQRFETKMITK